MTVHAPAERPRILAELTKRPGQTTHEVAAALGYGKPESRKIARIITRMWQRGELAAGTTFRPQQGREVRIFAVALPGTPPQPRRETPAQAKHRREADRARQARSRAKNADRIGQPRADYRSGTRTGLGRLVHAAACRADPGLFFGPDGEDPRVRGRRITRARAICFSCPIRARCLEVAEANSERFGIWGGVDFEAARPAVRSA
jgi:WhiB family redox-sensing transcriptional regulator